MIDLHCHSSESDGTLVPSELVQMAEAASLHALALTDHDTLNGVPEFLEAGRGRSVLTVPGVELACHLDGHHVHIVGLFIDHECLPLRALLTETVRLREERNRQILHRLQTLGCRINHEDVTACQGGEVQGRPHFAQALVNRGCCESVKHAFDRYLARGKSAYVARQVPPAAAAIAAIQAAGGVAVWAHPLMVNSMTRAKLERFCRRLQVLGLDGIETRYSDYTPNQERNADEVASRLGLLRSGGSDFHGDCIPGISVGRGRGNLCVPDDWLAGLSARARTRWTRVFS